MVRSHDQVAATALINSRSLSALFPLKVRQRLRQQFRRAVGESGRPARPRPGTWTRDELREERRPGDGRDCEEAGVDFYEEKYAF